MKTQMRFQKILLVITLILAALTLVYGFGFCTGSIAYTRAALTGEIMHPSYNADPIGADALESFLQGSGGFNNVIIYMSIAYLLVIVLMCLMDNGKRRNYYVTNYVATGIAVVFGLVFAVYSLIMINQCLGLFNDIDWETYKFLYDNKLVANYSESRASFIIGNILFIVVILDAVALALNAVWKYLLMRGEKALLCKGKAETAAEEVA